MQTRLEDNGIRETSIESYKQIIPELNNRQKQVIYILRIYPNLCNREISNIAKLPINSITPRVKELRDLGLIMFNDVKKDEKTNRNVNTWKVKV